MAGSCPPSLNRLGSAATPDAGRVIDSGIAVLVRDHDAVLRAQSPLSFDFNLLLDELRRDREEEVLDACKNPTQPSTCGTA